MTPLTHCYTLVSACCHALTFIEDGAHICHRCRCRCDTLVGGWPVPAIVAAIGDPANAREFLVPNVETG